MSVVTRTVITDADTGEKREAFSFKFGQPATKADVEALHEFLAGKSPPGLLAIAKAKLSEIEGLPEHASAARSIETADHFAALGQWDRVSAAVSDFSASYERAMRRKEIRQRRDALVAGGKKSADARRQKSLKIRARFDELIASGVSERDAKVACCNEFDLRKRQLRDALKIQK